MIRFDEIPELKLGELCGTVTDLTRRAFEDPEIRAEYQRWKEQHKQKKALPEGITEKAPERAALINSRLNSIRF